MSTLKTVGTYIEKNLVEADPPPREQRAKIADSVFYRVNN